MDREMEEKIEELKKKGMFREARVSKLGYGTFRMAEACSEEKLSVEHDHVRNKSLDISGTETKQAKQCQMELIFSDLRKISDLREESDVMGCIKGYKALSRYIEDVMALYTSKEHTRFVCSLNYALFNIKFHYLSLEGVLMHDSVQSAKKCSVKHFSYFLKEYHSLSRIFLESPLEEFIVVRPRDLERTMKTRMRMHREKTGVSL